MAGKIGSCGSIRNALSPSGPAFFKRFSMQVLRPGRSQDGVETLQKMYQEDVMRLGGNAPIELVISVTPGRLLYMGKSPVWIYFY